MDIKNDLNSLINFDFITFDTSYSCYNRIVSVNGEGHKMENSILINTNNVVYKITTSSVLASYSGICILDSDIVIKFITKHFGAHFIPPWIKEFASVHIEVI